MWRNDNMSNKVKVPGGAFYVGDGLTVDPMTRTVSAGGGGGGFEYDFIIKTTDGASYTLETGTYDSIMQKLGRQPITGKLLASVGDEARGDGDCIYIEYLEAQLIVYVFSGRANVKLAINQDNTVTNITK